MIPSDRADKIVTAALLCGLPPEHADAARVAVDQQNLPEFIRLANGFVDAARLTDIISEGFSELDVFKFCLTHILLRTPREPRTPAEAIADIERVTQDKDDTLVRMMDRIQKLAEMKLLQKLTQGQQS